MDTLQRYPLGQKSPYLARFLRYKHFCVLQLLRKIRKFKMAAIFGETKFFWKLEWLLCRDTLRIKNSIKIALSSMVFEIFAFLCFAILQKIWKFKMAPFLARQNLFENWHGYSAEIPCGLKILSKSLYLAQFSRYKHFCVLQLLRKIRKFKMAAIFGETKFFWKLEWLLCRDTLRLKNLIKIALSSTVFEIFAFLCFAILQKIWKFKMAPFLARQNLFENWHGYSAEIPCGLKILSKSLYLAQFSRYKHFCVLQLLRKIRKFKMAAIFDEINFLGKLC